MTELFNFAGSPTRIERGGMAKKIILIIIIIVVASMVYYKFVKPSKPEVELTRDLIYKRQSEARDMLRIAFQKQESYRAKHGTYARKIKELGIRERGHFYELRVLKATKIHFEMRAEGNIDDDDTYDVWMINESGQPKNLVNDIDQ